MDTRYIITLQCYPPALETAGETSAQRAARRARERIGRQGRIQTLMLPVNPETIQFRMGREAVDIALLQKRTVGRPGNVTPIECSLSEVMLPHPYFTPDGSLWLNVPHAELRDPWDTVRMLRDWQSGEGGPERVSLTPLRLTVADAKIVMWVVMTQMDPSTKPGEPGPAYVDFTFREVVDLPTITFKAGKAGKGGKSGRTNPAPAARVLVTTKGENIIDVCKRKYGKVTSDQVTEVYKLNKPVIGQDRTRTLPPGTRIKFPAP